MKPDLIKQEFGETWKGDNLNCLCQDGRQPKSKLVDQDMRRAKAQLLN